MKRPMLLALVLASIMLVVAFNLSGITAPVKTIKYFTSETDPTQVEVDKTIIQRFEAANPGVKVELIHGGFDDLLPKLVAMMKAGTAPDVAYFGPRYVAGLVNQKLLLRLDDLFKELGDIPRQLTAPTEDGHIYDIPIAMESEVLYYRKDLFKEAGISPPTNFDEWLKAAKTLVVDIDGDNRPDRWGISIQGKAPDNGVRFAGVLWSNGADYFDEKGNVAIDSPQAIQALKFWGELAKYAPPGVTNAGNFETGIQFAQGLTAMVKYPGRIMSIIDRYNPDLVSKIGVVPPPVGPSGSGKPVIWSPLNDFIVFSSTKNPTLAKKFIKFYMSDEQYLLLLTAAVPGHSLPVRKSWLNNEKYFATPAIARWKDIVKETMRLAFEYGTDFALRSKVPNPYVGQAVGGPTWTRLLNTFLAGEISAEEAVRNTANAWREEFGIK